MREEATQQTAAAALISPHVNGPDTDSFSARCQNREGHSPLVIQTAAFVHVLVLLAAGFALCFGESTNLT
jgi:hypothetical protein